MECSSVFLNCFIAKNIGLIASNAASAITGIVIYFGLFVKNAINFALSCKYNKAADILSIIALAPKIIKPFCCMAYFALGKNLFAFLLSKVALLFVSNSLKDFSEPSSLLYDGGGVKGVLPDRPTFLEGSFSSEF